MRAMLFDLDGTLVDTVYAHVIAWQQALEEGGLSIVAAKIHYRIGMSGELLVKETCAELGRHVSDAKFQSMDRRHAVLFKKVLPKPRPMPGAIELFKHLEALGVQRGIATSGARKSIASSLKSLRLDPSVIVVDRDATSDAKPEPDIFLECQKRLGAEAGECFVVGDSVWDVLAARRANILAVGLRCGGTSDDDLYRAGAFRVFDDPYQLLAGLGQLGIT